MIDELSSFKCHKSKRFKALRKVRPKIKRIVGLTGTPAPNSLMDLWSQINLLDMGERLGRFIGGYRDRYFTPDKRNAQIVFSYKLLQLANGAVYDENSKVKVIHDKKLDALEDLIESSNGKSILVFYGCKHDKDRIIKRFNAEEINTSQDITKWNNEQMKIAIAHPASAGQLKRGLGGIKNENL